jgi:hypothetical protein
MNRIGRMDRRQLISAAVASTLMPVGLAAAPSTAWTAEPRVRVSNGGSIAGIRRVMIGSFGLNFVTERKASQSSGGGFRSRLAPSNITVRTALTGLTPDDYVAAADAAYAAAIQALVAKGIEVVDNAALLASLRGAVAPQPNGSTDQFSEGGGSSVEMVRYGPSLFGGFSPLDGWVTTGGGLAGIANMGALRAGLDATAHLRRQASANDIAILGLLLTVNPVKMSADQSTGWRVPDAFGNGGMTRTTTISTETGLSSNPFKTWMDVYPPSGRPGRVTVQGEIGVSGGIGSLEDTTSGASRAIEGLGNVLSNPLLGGSGRSSNTTNYTLNADSPSYIAGVGALGFDIMDALAGSLV